MADRYSNFAELAKNEVEGTDYRVRVYAQGQTVVIIAPPGGRIEPGTSEIARAIAGHYHSLYLFEGLRDRPHKDLHVTSTNFDEPRCQSLIKSYKVVVAVHGLEGGTQTAKMGGLDDVLRDKISKDLNDNKFMSTIVTSGTHAAVCSNNICNKGQSRKRVQLEISRGMRDRLRQNKKDMAAFAETVRQAIEWKIAK